MDLYKIQLMVCLRWESLVTWFDVREGVDFTETSFPHTQASFDNCQCQPCHIELRKPSGIFVAQQMHEYTWTSFMPTFIQRMLYHLMTVTQTSLESRHKVICWKSPCNNYCHPFSSVDDRGIDIARSPFYWTISFDADRLCSHEAWPMPWLWRNPLRKRREEKCLSEYCCFVGTATQSSIESMQLTRFFHQLTARLEV